MWKSFNSDGQEFYKFQQSKQSLLNLNHLTLKDYDIYNIENLGLDLGQTQQYDRFKTISYILGEHFYSRNQKCYWYPSHIQFIERRIIHQCKLFTVNNGSDKNWSLNVIINDWLAERTSKQYSSYIQGDVILIWLW